MRNIGTETKVGIFVVLGILVLTYFTIRVGRIAVREVGYRVYTHVESAAGLDKNSPVRIAGVEIGKVESISLEGLKAKVTMHLPFSVQLPLGSKVYVKSAGLLGEKYIEISPGTGAEFIKANAMVEEGGPSADVDRVLTQLSNIGGDIQKVTRSLSNVLGGEEGEKSIKELVTGAKETMTNLQDITQTIQKGEGTLGKLVKDDTLYTEVKGTVASLRQVSETLEKGEGTLGKLVKDEALYSETKAAMTEAKETMANLRKVSEQIEKGEGTLGKLAKDEALYEDTRRAVKSVQKAADGISEVTPVTVLSVVLGLVNP